MYDFRIKTPEEKKVARHKWELEYSKKPCVKKRRNDANNKWKYSDKGQKYLIEYQSRYRIDNKDKISALSKEYNNRPTIKDLKRKQNCLKKYGDYWESAYLVLKTMDELKRIKKHGFNS